jgi:hypothetical protein
MGVVLSACLIRSDIIKVSTPSSCPQRQAWVTNVERWCIESVWGNCGPMKIESLRDAAPCFNHWA